MSQLRSLIAEISSFDPDSLSVSDLAAEVTEAVRGQQQLEVAVAGWIKNLIDRGGHHDLGYSSPTALLIDQARMSPAHANRVVGYSKAREKAPHAYAACADGRLSTDQARHLFAAAEAVPDAYPDAEEALVDIVEGSTRSTLVKRSPIGGKQWKAPATSTPKPNKSAVACRHHGSRACFWSTEPSPRLADKPSSPP